MNRRKFIKHAGHTFAIGGLLGSLGFTSFDSHQVLQLLREATINNQVLVLIYLQGGNDGLNTAVPLDQLSALNIVRPEVVLPENKLLKLPYSSLGLHPSLAGFQSLYNEGRLQVIQSVGYPNQSYSHFRSTDIWMSGSGSDQVLSTGWAGRYLEEQFPDYPIGYPSTSNPDPLSIEIGYGSSLTFQGLNSGMSMVISNPNYFYQFINNITPSAPNTDAGDKLTFVRLIEQQSQAYGKTVKAAASKVKQQQAYPATALGDQLKIVARLIAGGLTTPLYMVRMGGFDTHQGQVQTDDHTTGKHASLLNELNDAVMAFMADLKFLSMDDQVVGMTFSEFGRRIKSNASMGTDHGSSEPVFIFGNKVKGGVVGKNPVISPNTTFADNLPVQYDFRQVYASLLQQWLGDSASDTSTLLGSSFNTIQVIGQSLITEVPPETKDNSWQVSPNPCKQYADITITTTGEFLTVEAVDISGRNLGSIFSGNLVQGNHTLIWNTQNLPTGRYIIILSRSSGQSAKSVIKMN